MANRKKILIMGAAGRDFHNFNVCFRDNPEYEVIAFTATQIPNIAGRQYPPLLAGKLYPIGIPIESEQKLASLIKFHNIDEVVFSYSDVSHEYVMHKASLVNAVGARFTLLGTRDSMLRSKKPIVAVCAVRTGCGKSPTSRKVCEIVKEMGKKVVVVRHPMPYGDLDKQRMQRFATHDDLKKYDCTIEEIEEYEPHIEQHTIVYAGVDYEAVLTEAEKEADIIVWDGGNNDTPFYVPDIHITIVDPHRPGHELTYYPGETNFLMADIIVISKEDTAKTIDINLVKEHIKLSNPKAAVVDAALPITVEKPELIKGRRVLVVEDGPTLTHGGMAFGAGMLAAEKHGAMEIVDPRPYAIGSIAETFGKYPHMGKLLPAMGYGQSQMEELRETIYRIPCDVVIIGTPVDLRKIISINKQTDRVRYFLQEISTPSLKELIETRLKNFV
ncbi:MAG TPA: cyclic 2,3-diphosphoglycerate synthase [Candidatus Wunengus sp. YC63]|uniref:cyclic 2,3-diphosphoglycerate synthase n=1 Tax=Candidatus Wunengus sp. YC63 TaxID=3367699 RepID=UPI0027137BAC|nr:cyclic 2,3-diphosphoglycerate synthase [Candidatus Brocadiales bacterium]